MKLIVEVNKEDLDFIRKTFTQNSHDYIPKVIRNRFTDAVLNGTPIPDNATVCDIEQIRAEIEHEADYKDAYVDADVAKGMYMALEIIDKYTK